MSEAGERETASALIGFYDATRKAAQEHLARYTYTRQGEYDPLYEEHRSTLRALILLCEGAADALVVDYGG